jgi:hypothetical protein
VVFAERDGDAFSNAIVQVPGIIAVMGDIQQCVVNLHALCFFSVQPPVDIDMARRRLTIVASCDEGYG